MKATDKLIQIFKESKMISNTVNVSKMTTDLDEESYFSEDEEIIFMKDGLEYQIDFTILYTWDKVNSGGDGYNDENFNYAENGMIEDLHIDFIYDDEGNAYKADYKKDGDLLLDIEEIIKEYIY